MTGTDRMHSRKAAPQFSPAPERWPITVVGIGNEFRGDDAIGLTVLRQLKRDLPAGARAVELTGDQSYLLELMLSTDAMIIVDAVQSSAPAGTVFRVDASEDPVPEDFLSFSTHTFDSAGAVELARTLGSLPGRVLIYGIVGRNFSFAPGVAAEVEEVIEIVAARIINDINHIITGRRAGRRRSSAAK